MIAKAADKGKGRLLGEQFIVWYIPLITGFHIREQGRWNLNVPGKSGSVALISAASLMWTVLFTWWGIPNWCSMSLRRSLQKKVRKICLVQTYAPLQTDRMWTNGLDHHLGALASRGGIVDGSYSGSMASVFTSIDVLHGDWISTFHKTILDFANYLCSQNMTYLQKVEHMCIYICI